MADETPKPKRRGRPKGSGRKYQLKDFEQPLLDWIAAGKTVRDFCRQDNHPSNQVVYEWRMNDDEFAERFTRAREIGFDAIAEETVNIIDTEPEFAESWSDGGGSKRRDAAFVQWQKNRVELRLKLLAKWAPKKYGDQVGENMDGNRPIHISIVNPNNVDD